MSLTKHFEAWRGVGMTLGKMEEAKVLHEAGGGSGRIDFTTANVTRSVITNGTSRPLVGAGSSAVTQLAAAQDPMRATEGRGSPARRATDPSNDRSKHTRAVGCRRREDHVPRLKQRSSLGPERGRRSQRRSHRPCLRGFASLHRAYPQQWFLVPDSVRKFTLSRDI